MDRRHGPPGYAHSATRLATCYVVCVAHRYEEFDDDHTAVDYRVDISLPTLASALA
jgi:hypothetical protein